MNFSKSFNSAGVCFTAYDFREDKGTIENEQG